MTIRILKSRNTTIGTESLPAPEKNRNPGSAPNCDPVNRPFPMLCGLFPTFAIYFQSIDNPCPFPFRFDDHQSARARHSPQHVAENGGRGRTRNN